MKNVYINAIGYYVPDGRLSNNQILDRIKVANQDSYNEEEMEFLLYGCQRKFEFLGINSRSYCENIEEDNAVSMAVKACQSALDKAGKKASEIECMLFSGVCNPFREPSFALVLADRLGMETGDFFDINDTCNGFMKSIDIAHLYIKSGKYKNVLIVTSENPHEIAPGLQEHCKIDSIEDIDKKFSLLFAGSGAAAMLLSSRGRKGKIEEYSEKRETKNWDSSLLAIPGTRVPKEKFKDWTSGMYTDSRLLSALIIKDGPEFFKSKIDEWNINIEDINYFFMYQLGNNITYATLDKLDVPFNKAPINTFDEYGNMASANIPVTLAKALEQKMIKKGDKILLVGSSCGLTYSLVKISW